MKIKYFINPLMVVSAVAIPTVSISSCTETKIKVSSINISATSSKVKQGSILQINASVEPVNATNKDLEWVSYNESIISFTSAGIARGIGLGTTKIYAKATDGSGVTSNEWDVTVTENKIYVESINLDDTIYVVQGKTTTPNYSITPSNATNKQLEWFVGNENVATVNKSTGLITGVTLGTTTLTAAATDNSGKSKTVEITVVSTDEKITNISLPSVSVRTGQTYKCSPTITPVYATNKTLNWSVGDTSIATVSSNGTVTGIKKGTTTITCAATDGSGKSATASLTVTGSSIVEEPTDYIHNRTFSLRAVGGRYMVSGTGWIISDATPSNTTDYVYNIATNWHVTDGFDALTTPITMYVGDSTSTDGISSSEYYQINSYSYYDKSYSYYTGESKSGYDHVGIDLRVIKMNLSNVKGNTKTKLNTLNTIQQELGYITQFADDATPSKSQMTSTMYTGGFPFSDSLYTSKWEYHELDTASLQMEYYLKNSELSHDACGNEGVTEGVLCDISPQYCIDTNMGTSWMSGGASGSMLLGNYDGELKVAGIYWGGWGNDKQGTFYPCYSVFKTDSKNFLSPWIN